MISRRCVIGGLLAVLALVWMVSPLVLVEAKAPKTQPAGDKPKSDAVTVTIYSTGDLHNNSAPLVRIAGFIKQEKKKDPNVLFIDCGDFLHDGRVRNPLVAASRGEAMVSAMTATGYDVCILGNHDYMYGRIRIFELTRKYPKWPVTVCNMNWADEDKEKAGKIPRYRIFELKGVKVGVIGSGSHYRNHQHGPPFPVYREEQALVKLIPELREKADVIAVVTHIFDASDHRLLNQLVKAPPDVLFGAHSHARGVWLYDPAARKKSRTSGVMVAKAGSGGTQLAQVIIKWDPAKKKIAVIHGRIIRADKNWPEDPETKAAREVYIKPKEPKPEKAPAAAGQAHTSYGRGLIGAVVAPVDSSSTGPGRTIRGAVLTLGRMDSQSTP